MSHKILNNHILFRLPKRLKPPPLQESLSFLLPLRNFPLFSCLCGFTNDCLNIRAFSNPSLSDCSSLVFALISAYEMTSRQPQFCFAALAFLPHFILRQLGCAFRNTFLLGRRASCLVDIASSLGLQESPRSTYLHTYSRKNLECCYCLQKDSCTPQSYFPACSDPGIAFFTYLVFYLISKISIPTKRLGVTVIIFAIISLNLIWRQW